MTSREGSGGRAHRGHRTPPRGRAVRGVFMLRFSSLGSLQLSVSIPWALRFSGRREAELREALPGGRALPPVVTPGAQRGKKGLFNRRTEA